MGLVILFFVVVGGCTLIGKILGNVLFPRNGNSSGYIDKSINVHHHYHDNRSINVDGKEFKNLK